MTDLNSDIFCQIGDTASDAYFVFELETNTFQNINPSFEAIWGIPMSSVLDSPDLLFDTVHREDIAHVKNCYNSFIDELTAKKCDFRIVSATDGVKYIRLSIYPILNKGKLTKIAGIAEDSSVVKSNIFYMEKINARKNSTLEILAHDLKGPLGMISLLASSIEREASLDGKESILKSVRFIRDMCKRNINLIRSLVNQEFLESTEVNLRKERADLVWEISDVIKNYKNSEEYIAKTFVLTSSHDKLLIEVDSLKFMQVINNLISNSIKFTPDDGVIAVNIEDKRQVVLISVSDNGIGIPQDLHPYLFDKFTRARRKGLKGEDPVGLGMSIIRTIVELHGGKIWFDSEENAGSTFYIELPKS
jgi:two-component system sensor histidine kinase VicK